MLALIFLIVISNRESVLSAIFCYQITGVVGRAVIHNYPFEINLNPCRFPNLDYGLVESLQFSFPIISRSSESNP